MTALRVKSAPERHEDVRKLHLVGGSGRSPGSWVQGADRAPSAASTFPGLFPMRPSGLRRQLPTHGGGTAPVLHRLPCYAPEGTRGMDCQAGAR